MDDLVFSQPEAILAIQAVLAICDITDGWQLLVELATFIGGVVPFDELWLTQLTVAASAPGALVWRGRRSDASPSDTRVLARFGGRVRSPGAAAALMSELGGSVRHLTMATTLRGRTGRAWTLTRHGEDFTDAEIATATALLPLVASLDRLAEARMPAGETSPADGGVLSAREQRVLAMVADGLTAAAIGHRLGIAPATVRKHLEHVYAKLGRHDRLTAVAYARQIGLLSVS